MSLVNDYFLLYHGVHYESKSPTQLIESEDDVFYEFSALVLSCNRKNFDHFLSLDNFVFILKKLSKVSVNSLDTLFQLQYTLIEYIKEHHSLEHISKLHQAFTYLNEQEILDSLHYKKLVSLFDPNIFHSFEETSGIDEKEASKDFLERKSDLKGLIAELKMVREESSFEEELKKVDNYLDKQKFSIGITGVMNAGKSTLLNALIGKEVLGSSVVPETANLSLLKYAEKPYAKVFYWTKNEWEKIVYSAKEFEGIALFVKESKNTFKDQLDAYITQEGRVDAIIVDELSHYTSAQHKISNLIKKIELGVELDFLSEGIEIVDTPGLDDIVIQRETITKEYLSQCDMMIHLMNVSQSATKKDIDFIIDALLYQNVGKLLVVLTRADSVKEKELQEVISYTKKSIRAQLHLLNADNKLDFILGALEFIAVSSKMALLHRNGEEAIALEAGYSLEKTGILELESYLHESLYGNENQKSELIINSAKVRLVKVLETQMKALEFELRLLSKNEGELAKELEVFNLKKDENKTLITQMQVEIEGYKKHTQGFVDELEGFLKAQIFRIKQRLFSRLMDDFAYALEKKEKKAFIQTLNDSIPMALKDALIDVLRDYRYKFISYSQDIGKKIESEYEKYEIHMGKSNEDFSILDMVNEHFKSGLLHASHEHLSLQLKKTFESYKRADDSSLALAIETYLNESFDLLIQEIREKSEIISERLLEEFFLHISQPLESFEMRLQTEEELLSRSLINYEKDEQKRASKAIELHQEIKRLLEVSRKCAL